MLLLFWCILSLLILLASILIHASTFLGFDPMDKIPGVMFLHIAIFPPFIAAIIYAGKLNGAEKSGQEAAIKHSPRWLKFLTGVFGAYALINFIIFVALSETGGPHIRDGKYVLSRGNTIIRELSADEFHRHQAYVVRGFSGHWMLFACAALMILTGVREVRKTALPIPLPEPPKPDPIAAAIAADPAPQPTTMRAGLTALVSYILCLLFIFSTRPALCFLAAIFATIAAVLALRQRFSFPYKPFQSVIGRLCVIPNALISSFMGRLVSEFVYIAIYVGLSAAITGEVRILSLKAGPAHLSDGSDLHYRAWSAMTFLIQFPLLGLGVLGLTHMAEHIGRLIEIRRRAPRRWT